MKLLREIQEGAIKYFATSYINFSYLLLCTGSVFAHLILYLLGLLNPSSFTDTSNLPWSLAQFWNDKYESYENIGLIAVSVLVTFRR